MINPTAAPRESLTEAQVTGLINGLAVQVDAGCETLDKDGNLLADISDMLILDGSSVSWEAAAIHRRCRVVLTGAIDFGAVRLRPYMTLTDGAVTARFNLGVFLPVAVGREYDVALGEVYTVEGLDRLVILDTPVGSTLEVQSADVYLDEAETLIDAIDPGTVTVLDDGDQGAETLPAARVWELDDRTTYLSVVNDLLYAVGYRELWSDIDGNYRFSQYLAPSERAPEWTYDWNTDATAGPDRTEESDWFAAPNSWVFIRERPSVGVASADSDGSDGRYEVTNTSDGRTSVDSRDGLTRNRIVRVDAADQASLIDLATRIVDDEKRVIVRRKFKAEPNPLHDHYDVVQLVDDVFGTGKAQVVAWSLPLNGGQMDLTAEMVG